MGIRIAALPPAKPVGTQGGDDDDDEHEGCVLSDEEDEDEVDEGEEETLIGANEARNGGGYGSVSHKGVKSRSLTPNVVVRRRYRRGGRSVWKPWTWFRLSRRTQTRTRSNSTSRANKNKNRAWLNPTLSILFAITTPVGMALGMLLWGLGSRAAGDNPTGGTDKAQQHLISGLLSAISAGLLIYASTVEMIAGDFVFGDVDGGHGHGHGGGGGGDLEDHVGDEGEGEGGDGEGQSKVKIGKRALAVVSLLAGSGMMVLVGLGE